MRRLALVLAAFAAAPGCRERPQPPPAAIADAAPAPVDPNERFDDFVRAWLDGYTAFAPTAATWLGLHGADDKLDDAGAAALAREAQRLRRTLERLDAFPDATLDERHRLDKLLLERDIRLALFELTELRPQERSPLHYIDLFSAGLYELLARDFEPLPERLKDLNGRLARARAFFDDARRDLKNPPELLTRRAADLGQGTRAFIAETLPRVYAALGDDRLAADFRAAQAEALRALDDYLGYLARDLQPRSKGDLPLGRAHLAERLQHRELTQDPADALLGNLVAAGDRELKLAVKRFEETARQAFPGKSPADGYRQLEDDHPAAAQLLPAVGSIVEQLFRFTAAEGLVTLPAVRPRVVEMPPYLWGFVRMSLPGPFEPQPRDELYVDPANRAWDRRTTDEHLRAFARAQLVQTLAREAVAHQVQAEAARRAPTIMQKLTVDEAFAEGWPRYFAQVIVDAGFVPDPAPPAANIPAGSTPPRPDPRADLRVKLAQRRESLLVLCRFVAALRFHAQAARLEDVVNLFADQCYLEDSVARREAERVAADPDVLNEGLGYLALVKLRDDAKRERGDDFDPRRFHDELLAHGQLPLGLLRRRVLREPGPHLL